MDKGIISVDVPKCCLECDAFQHIGIDGKICCLKKNLSNDKGYYNRGLKEDFDKNRPGWCPIKPINPNLIKALRCFATQDAFKDCMVDRYNKERCDEKRMSCKPLPNDATIPCPYQQDEFSTNCQEGDCMDWLNQIADLLEGK